ncbi:MAG: hypothetical protein DRI01_05100 [Chloroflexi bacterium]|nr:MAG: hypothetical protein DRI01_05100 [Chloroflexota bacterium]
MCPSGDDGKDETRGAIIATLIFYDTKSYFCRTAGLNMAIVLYVRGSFIGRRDKRDAQTV